MVNTRESLLEQLAQVQREIKRLQSMRMSYYESFYRLEPLLCKEAHLKKLLGV